MSRFPVPTASHPADDHTRWSAGARLALRFAVLYFGMYAAATQLAGGVLLVPGASLPALGQAWPLRDVTIWVATNVVGFEPPLVYTGNSGDTAFHWVQTLLLLVLAIAGTALWTVLGRPRVEGPGLHTWFRLGARFVLAAQMFYYGMAKVVPTQFQAPSLVTLVQPVGSLSLSDLLWTFIGASTPYQMAAGLAEVLASMLLVVPRTAMLGALVCLFDMAQVFALNMAYDFGLKQISFHLILLSLALLVPDAAALSRWWLQRRPTGIPFEERLPLVATARGARAAVVAQVVFGAYLLVMFTNLSLGFWSSQGDGRPRSPLYGIWDVTELWMDGAVIAPSAADYGRRWRRVIFDGPDVVAFQRLDDSIAHYGVTVVPERRALELTKGRSRTWRALFAFERADADRLSLTGEMDGHHIQVRLRRVALDTFRLRGSRFRWVRPPDPFAG